MSKATALVLGATGFIGSHIVRACLQHGVTVRAFRRPTSSTLAWDGIDQPFTTVIGDLRDRASLVAAMQGCDTVFHAAGYYPTRSVGAAAMLAEANAQMTNVLQAAQQAGVGKVVYTSSLATVGPPGHPNGLARESDRFPEGDARHPYWTIKLRQEAIARRFHDGGLPVVTLNPTVVFGPGDAKRVTGRLLIGARRMGCRVYIRMPLNVVDVRDVAAAHVCAAERGASGERYIIGGDNTNAHALIATLADVEGLPPPRLRAPVAPWYFGPARLFERLLFRLRPQAALLMPTFGLESIRLAWGYDVSKARRELAWQPAYPLTDTLRDSMAWFRQHGYL